MKKVRPKVVLDSRFNARCRNFIDSGGDLGPWGKKIVSTIHNIENNACFTSGALVEDLCPKYSSLSDEEKDLFWVWAYASIAQVESSCDTEAKNHNATYGRADGLFQLEYSRSLRRQSGRDAVYCRTTIPYPTTKVDFQIECTTSIIKDVHCSSEPPRSLNWQSGYWHRLRGDGTITQKIRSFPLCK
jgi:hypothetical protein